MASNLKAFILAAGLGSRLRPLTDLTPKPMLPIGDKPLLERQLALLKKFGITDCAINTYHLPNQIEDYFGDGSRLGMKLQYIHETELSGTAGPIQKLPEFFTSPFIVIYGDDLTNIDIDYFYRFHSTNKALVTIALYNEEYIESKGMVVINRQNRITSFKEKPMPNEVISHLANAGIYICEPGILEWIEKNAFSDFGKDIFPKLLQNNIPIYGYVMDEYLLDIGTPENYRQAQIDISRLEL